MATEIPVNSIKVVDDDIHLTIDPETLKVQGDGAEIIIPQHSKNSERISFSLLGRIIEGHDVSTCNKVEVHFRNIGSSKVNPGIYEVTDLQAGDADEVTFSWLIDDPATQLTGGLVFSIHFMNIAENGDVEYDLPTFAFAEISVGETVWLRDDVIAYYPDIIDALGDRIDVIENEVVDIRVGYDGTQYANAGEAVREQTKQALAAAGIVVDVAREVQGIRTGFDGTVYPTAGEAVRAQALQAINAKMAEEEVLADGTVNIVLGEKGADDIPDNPENPDNSDEPTNITDTLTWTDNTYISAGGGLNAADGFYYSNLITLNKGEAIRVIASGGTAAAALISKWSNDGTTFLACVHQAVGNTVETAEHIATETEYLRVCYNKYYTTKDGGALIVETFYAGIEEPDEPGIPEAPEGTEVSQINGMNLADKWARQAIEAIFESENNSADVSVEPLDDGTVNIDFGIADEPKTNITDTLTWTENTYIKAGGGFATADSFRYSNLITLNKGEAIRVTAAGGSAIALISKWSSDGNTFLACIHQAQGTAVETAEHIATETEYLRISYNKYFTTKDGGSLVVETYVAIKPEVSQIDSRKIIDTEARAIIADLTAEVERLSNINNPLTGKSIVVDGDSITYGQGNNQNGTYTGWADIIATQNGMNLSKFAKSGATLTSGSNSICDRVSTLTAADYIIISGGYNDYANGVELGELTEQGFRIGTDTIDTFESKTLDKTKVVDAVEYIVRYLLSTYPTKKLGFVFTHKVGAEWYNPKKGTYAHTLKEYHDAILSVLEKYSFPYCDLTQISRFNTGTPTYAANFTNNGDAIHPNQGGYEIGYVPQITAWLKTL